MVYLPVKDSSLNIKRYLYSLIYRVNLNMLVPYYLICSYLYYEKEESIISDQEYDKLCTLLLDNFKEVEHYHKDLLDKGSLYCGSGFDLIYPNIVKSCADRLLKDEIEKAIFYKNLKILEII